jgi:hypothetical protein
MLPKLLACVRVVVEMIKTVGVEWAIWIVFAQMAVLALKPHFFTVLSQMLFKSIQSELLERPTKCAF